MRLTAAQLDILEDRPLDAIEDVYTDTVGPLPDDFGDRHEALVNRLASEKTLEDLDELEEWIVADMIYRSTYCCAMVEEWEFGTGRQIIRPECRRLYPKYMRAGRTLAAQFSGMYPNSKVTFPEV